MLAPNPATETKAGSPSIAWRVGRGPLDRTVVVAQFPGMITSRRTPQHFEHQSPCRLVVKARTPIGPTSGFVWEIIRDAPERQVVSRSSVSYSSMEDAYEHGAIAIKRVGSKAQ
jgi:hypothetical protein